jgi:hypothetical protein
LEPTSYSINHFATKAATVPINSNKQETADNISTMGAHASAEQALQEEPCAPNFLFVELLELQLLELLLELLLLLLVLLLLLLFMLRL